MGNVDSSECCVIFYMIKNVSFYKKIEMIHVTAFPRSMELVFNLKTGFLLDNLVKCQNVKSVQIR